MCIHSTERPEKVPDRRGADVEHGNSATDLAQELADISRDIADTYAFTEHEPSYVVEAVVATASVVGEAGQAKTSTVEAEMSAEAARSVALTKLDNLPDIYTSELERYKNSSGQVRSRTPRFTAGYRPNRASEICKELGIKPDAIGKAMRRCGTGNARTELKQELKRERPLGGATTSSKPGPSRPTPGSAEARAPDNLEGEDSGEEGGVDGKEGLRLPRAEATHTLAETSPSRGFQGSRGIQGVGVVDSNDTRSCKCRLPNSLAESKTLILAEAGMCYHDTPVCKKMDMPDSGDDSGGDEVGIPVLVRRALARRTCEHATRQLIYQYVPEAKDDPVLFRWCVYALWTTWTDQTTHRRVIHHKILHWIGHYRFQSGKAVLQYVKDRLPSTEHSNTWVVGQHTRQIIRDGLPEELWKAVDEDLSTPPGQYQDRVYVLSGDPVGRQDASDIRAEIEEEISELQPPSDTAERIWNYMNEVPPRRFARFDDKIGKAIEYVDRMEIDVEVSPKEAGLLRYYSGCEKTDDGELTGDVTRYKARLRHEKRKLAHQQRAQYKQILHQIALQHKPYYGFSRQERTDRIFGHNPSVLRLPTEVREILCEGLYDVDLKSAHLLIAAWLWDAEEALETLTQEGYSIWDDLMEHCRPLFEEQGLEVPETGSGLYEEVKAGMKIMVYSTVYGMPAPSIQANVTKALKPILGPDVGDHLKTHPVIQQLIDARDEKLQALEPGDTLEAPSGIEIEVEVTLQREKEDDCNEVGPKSAMATHAQSYEQELMSVLIGVAEERTEFRPILWLHDGAECAARRPNGLEKAVNDALTAKQEELTEFAGKDTLLPAIFEVEKIEAPEMPPETVHDRIASASGGAVRLKDGETAVKVDPQTGEEMPVPDETGPASHILLAHEHELYRVADTYIQVTDDGYTTTTDPYPEVKLWNDTTTTNSTSSTSSSRTTSPKTPPPADPTADTTSPDTSKTAPGAESRSMREDRSPTSDTSTTGAQPVSRSDKKSDALTVEDLHRQHQERKRRIAQGNVPDNWERAKDAGFSAREWKRGMETP